MLVLFTSEGTAPRLQRVQPKLEWCRPRYHSRSKTWSKGGKSSGNTTHVGQTSTRFLAHPAMKCLCITCLCPHLCAVMLQTHSKIDCLYWNGPFLHCSLRRQSWPKMFKLVLTTGPRMGAQVSSLNSGPFVPMKRSPLHVMSGTRKGRA